MYGREVNGELHTFGVSGKLIMNALVMYDHQTRTLWSQFLGKGVKGPLAGVELEFVPVTQTTWQLWRELHADTKVLDKKGRYQSDSYSGYYTGRSAGVLGESRQDKRLDRKDLVVGVDIGGRAKVYPLSALAPAPSLNDSVAGRELLVFFESSTGTALVYDRNVDGRALTFQVEEGYTGAQSILVDGETGIRWLALTGTAVEGELRGKSLSRLPSHLSFWFAWKDWHPDTEVYGS